MKRLLIVVSLFFVLLLDTVLAQSPLEKSFKEYIDSKTSYIENEWGELFDVVQLNSMVYTDSLFACNEMGSGVTSFGYPYSFEGLKFAEFNKDTIAAMADLSWNDGSIDRLVVKNIALIFKAVADSFVVVKMIDSNENAWIQSNGFWRDPKIMKELTDAKRFEAYLDCRYTMGEFQDYTFLFQLENVGALNPYFKQLDGIDFIFKTDTILYELGKNDETESFDHGYDYDVKNKLVTSKFMRKVQKTNGDTLDELLNIVFQIDGLQVTPIGISSEMDNQWLEEHGLWTLQEDLIGKDLPKGNALELAFLTFLQSAQKENKKPHALPAACGLENILVFDENGEFIEKNITVEHLFRLPEIFEVKTIGNRIYIPALKEKIDANTGESSGDWVYTLVYEKSEDGFDLSGIKFPAGREVEREGACWKGL